MHDMEEREWGGGRNLPPAADLKKVFFIFLR
jgi:hypothetical protein